MPKAKVTKQEKTVLIEIPVAEVPDVTFGLRVDAKLSPRQSNALRWIVAGLNGRLGVYANATGGAKNAEAVRCILESVADQMGIDEKGESQ